MPEVVSLAEEMDDIDIETCHGAMGMKDDVDPNLRMSGTGHRFKGQALTGKFKSMSVSPGSILAGAQKLLSLMFTEAESNLLINTTTTAGFKDRAGSTRTRLDSQC
ncbi:hypothetical protein O9K51_03975 [Purpureocillium lavendulum]|uniref:Uncharacterized protein n=1 Tax=Purpureocillium lavendulum TaxID=1247861 RepID=A0AB34FXP5_9HYPO|nr:hypothetical protein O9K51_03975 [Purpureocillium lavendulum]